MRQTIEYVPGALLPALIVAAIAAAALWFVKRPGMKGLAVFFLVSFCAVFYALFACRILFNITKFGIYGDSEPWHGNYIPFTTIWDYISQGNILIFLMQVVGNALVTIPLPLVVWFYSPKRIMKRVCAASLIITAFIEPVQLLINLIHGGPSNIIDVDDLILNLTGCGLGLLLAAAANRLWKARTDLWPRGKS